MNGILRTIPTPAAVAAVRKNSARPLVRARIQSLNRSKPLASAAQTQRPLGQRTEADGLRGCRSPRSHLRHLSSVFPQGNVLQRLREREHTRTTIRTTLLPKLKRPLCVRTRNAGRGAWSRLGCRSVAGEPLPPNCLPRRGRNSGMMRCGPLHCQGHQRSPSNSPGPERDKHSFSIKKSQFCQPEECQFLLSTR